MNSAKVQLISDCFVKPKFESEESNKPIHLSPWDLMMLSVSYIQRGLVFPMPENQDFSITTFLEHLKHSLSAALTHFHPLAARLTTVKQENPSSFTIFLNPENSPGARFIHSTANLSVNDIITPTYVPSNIVELFFDHYKAICYDGNELSLLSVQVTELIDGIVIGCSMNHMVADGTSFWHFFNSWSELFRSNSISRIPVHDRWIPEGSDPIFPLPFTHEDEFLERPVNDPLLRERIFHFSSDSLSRLKAKVNLECDTTKISTLQSLSALVWRCITRARRMSADEETSCGQAANIRSRISPPVHENYFGNLINGLSARATARELLDNGVGLAALRMHEAVANYGDKEIKDVVNLWVRSPFVIKLGEIISQIRNGVNMGSSPRFDMYGNEFGLGKALTIVSGYSYKFDGKVDMLQGREGRGSIDLKICLLSDNMTALESDEEFMNVVN